MRVRFCFPVAIFAVAVASLVTVARAERVTISAAISLQTPLARARGTLEKAGGLAISYNFGASGALATQIAHGAPVDVFISADRATIDRLDEKSLLAAGSRAALASNALVLIVPAERVPGAPAVTSFGDLAAPGFHRLAIGDPAVVPAGLYAREALESLQLYDGLRGAGKLVMAENVAQVLTYVARGEVDAGLVYATDAAAAAESIHRVAEAPAGSHEAMVYVVAIPRDSPHPAAARAVRQALLSPAFQAVLAEYGFAPPPAAGGATTGATSAAASCGASGEGGANPGAENDSPGRARSVLRPWLLSAQIAGGATLMAVLLGVPFAWALSRRRVPGQFLVETALLLPLVLPPTVVGFGLLYVLGREGVTGYVAGISLLFTRTGATIACMVIIFPLVVIPCRAAFASIATALLEDAQLLGATRVQLLVHVAIPLAGRGIFCGILLGFARALGEFGATIMVVGTNERLRTLPLQIYYDAALTGDILRAAPAVLALTVTSAVVALALTRLGLLAPAR